MPNPVPMNFLGLKPFGALILKSKEISVGAYFGLYLRFPRFGVPYPPFWASGNGNGKPIKGGGIIGFVGGITGLIGKPPPGGRTVGANNG